MRPKQLLNFLPIAFQAGQPVLIKGPPGGGKSDLVAQACAAMKWDLQISHPAVSDPTDYKGMPCIVPGAECQVSGEKPDTSHLTPRTTFRAEFLPFGDLNKLIEAQRPTVAFLDDIGQSPAAVQAALMQLILARRVNGHRISDHVVFCGATNDTNHMAGVSGLLEPVKSRFSTIVELEVSADDWSHWALDNDMPAELIAFIRFRPKLLCDFKPTRALTNSPCPRTVAAVGRWFNAGVRDLDVFAGAAGEGFATEFIAFLGMYATLPNLDDVILNPTTAAVPENPATCYAVICGLARKTTKANCERVFTYLARLEKEFEVCCVRDIARTKKDVVASPAFIKWVTRNGDVLN